MKDIVEGPITWSCMHKKVWPPFKIKKWGSSRNARLNGVGEHVYEQLKVWEKVCGLTEMGDKCRTCPCVQKIDSTPKKALRRLTQTGRK